MIIKLLMDLLKGLILFVIGLLPSMPDMSGLLGSVEAVISVLLTIDSIISVRLVGTCLGILILIAQADLLWSMIMWVIRKIPGVS